MTTPTHDVVTIVVLAALQQQAEQAAITAEPTFGAGTFVPGSALRKAGDATNTPYAYFARWNMQQGQRDAFATSLGGPLNVYSPGQTPHLNRDRWLFDSNTGWSLGEVMEALGLDYMISEE